MEELKKYNTEQLNQVTGAETNVDGQIIIPVIQEELYVGKKEVETGKVHIIKTVSEQQELVNISLTHEEVNVERVPVNQYIDTLPAAIRYEGDVTIVPVVKEVLVVEKKLLLVEELHITKNKVQSNETHEVTLRAENVQVGRTKTDSSL